MTIHRRPEDYHRLGLKAPGEGNKQYLLDALDRRRQDRLRLAASKPPGWKKPYFNTDEYRAAYSDGWITNEEFTRDYQAYQVRRDRALAGMAAGVAPPPRRWLRPEPYESRQYCGYMATAPFRDRRITGEAKALLAIIRARIGNKKSCNCTKYALANQIGRSLRSVQRYIRDLIHWGYISTEIRRNERGSHTGLIIRLCKAAQPFWKDDGQLATWLENTTYLPDPFDMTFDEKRDDPGLWAELFDFSGETDLSSKNYNLNNNIIIGKWAPYLAALWLTQKRKAPT